MSISTLFDVANTALNAQKVALEVTGENITNVNTAGYSRQTALLETLPTTMERGLPLGSGVKVAAILRSYDSFLQGQMMTGNSNLGYAKTTSSALQMAQPMFNDLTADGLGKSLQNFFNAWQDLSANPQGVPERQSVLSTGQQLVDNFHRINTYLTSVKDNMNQSLQGLTSDINDQLGQIAQLNSTIRQVEVSGQNANELRDQRELLLRQLSENVGVSFVELSDGSVNVSTAAGQALVTNNNAAVFSLSPNAANSNYYDILLAPPGGGGAANVTATIGGTGNSQGNMGAMLKVRDTTINGYVTSLNELASTLSTQVNTLHSAGFGLSGSTGVNFFSTPATAANIAVAIASASDIAAASADPAAGGSGNNLNSQAIASVFNTTYAMTGGSVTMTDFYTSLVGRVGVDVQGAGRSETQTDALVRQLDNLRESTSGVSLDEELSNLTKYQKAYQGAAKMINVATDMLDTVLGLVR